MLSEKFSRVLDIFSDSIIFKTVRGKTSFKRIEFEDQDLKKVFSVDSVYSHQLEAFQCVDKNRDLLLVSPTNSGKTLSYLFPLYKKWVEDHSRKFIFIFPTISLVNAKLLEFQKVFPSSEVAVYTGDVEVAQRRKVRLKSPSVLIFTPELFHQSFVCSSKHWKSIYSKVYSIVLDEIHLYSGYFGANFSWILERFLRNCKLHNVSPVLIGCSGTVQNVQFVIDNFYFDRNPKVVYGEEIRLADQLFCVAHDHSFRYVENIVELSKYGSKSLVFGISRQEVEKLCFSLKECCAEQSLPLRIFTYRGGLDKAERTLIENRLESGEYDIVVSTSALEIGLNIKDLDNVIIYGYPFTKESFFQRIGRAGRTQSESAVICLLHSKRKLDKAYRTNPSKLLKPLSKSDKKPLFDRNCEIVKNTQLWLMSLDYGISVYEDTYKKYRSDVDWLVETQVLQDKLLSFEGRTPGPDLGIREYGRVLELKYDNEVIGSIDIYNSLSFLYVGNDYIHQGVRYTIDSVLKTGVFLVDYNNEPSKHPSLQHSVEVCNFRDVADRLLDDSEVLRKNYAYVAFAHVCLWNNVKDSFVLTYDNTQVFCIEYLRHLTAVDSATAREVLELFYENAGISLKRSIRFFIEKTKLVFYDTDASGVSMPEFAKHFDNYSRSNPQYKIDKLTFVSGYMCLKKFFKGKYKRAVFARLLDESLLDDSSTFEIECVSFNQSKTQKVTFAEFVEVVQNFRLLIGFFSEDALSTLDKRLSSVVHYVNMQSSLDVACVSYESLLHSYSLNDEVSSVRKIYEKGTTGYLPINSKELSRIQCLWN